MSTFYTQMAASRKDDQLLQDCVHKTVQQVSKLTSTFDQPGILLGKIQSGKTRAFLGIMASCFDNGYEQAIVLTKGTKTLAKQTLNRIKQEFADFIDDDQVQVLDIMNVPNLSKYELDQKLIFIVKKQKDNLTRLVKLVEQTHPELAVKRTLLIDDEADLASIRFFKSKETEEIEAGTISQQIDKLRHTIKDMSFLQVTATPYSLYLQPKDYDKPDSPLGFLPKRPTFTELVPIHSNYVGGDQYFGNWDEASPHFYLYENVPLEEQEALRAEDRRVVRKGRELETAVIGKLRTAIVNFIGGVATRRWQETVAGEKPGKFSLIIHNDVKKSAHRWQDEVVKDIIDALTQAIAEQADSVENLIKDSFDNLEKSVKAAGNLMPPIAEYKKAFKKILTGGELTLEMVNSDNAVDALLDQNGELRLRTPGNIFVGGNILDRGITVPNLIGFYYGRNPKRMQQDTVLQHARMYGNRPLPDMAVTRFYTSLPVFEALRRIHEFDSALREAFIKGANDKVVAFLRYDTTGRVAPCSPNKIMVSEVISLKAGGRLLPVGFQTKAMTHIKGTIQTIDKQVEKLAVLDNPSIINLGDGIQIIEEISKTFEFEAPAKWDWESFKGALRYYAKLANEKSPEIACYALDKRTISRKRPSGRFSDAPDTKQQADTAQQIAKTIPMLLLLRQEGKKEDGWMGTPFWWPILFAPFGAKPTIFTTSDSD